MKEIESTIYKDLKEYEKMITDPEDKSFWMRSRKNSEILRGVLGKDRSLVEKESHG